jgi:allophanate hydrolase
MSIPEEMSIQALRSAYAAGLQPADLVSELLRRIQTYDDPALFIYLLSEAELLAQALALSSQDASSLPLYGIPFVVKDNIDLAGVPTTAGCPAFAQTPSESAPVVQALLDAGAICLGKTNLDQFATGLVGTRSPYGTPRNPHHPEYIPGGSSSGSAAAVAAGLASFGLGTDTAGSGRVPAAFCGLVGWKPSRGLLSTRGVVPAVASLDCVSVFARTAADCAAVRSVVAGFDPADPFARAAPEGGSARPQRIGVPRPGQLDFMGDAAAQAAYAAGCEALAACGCELVPIDFAPFSETAEMLYGGPWVAERYAAVGRFVEHRQADCDPSVGGIIVAAKTITAVQAFEADYRLRALRRAVEPVWGEVDAIAVPTTPTIYTRAEIAADPVGLNSILGRTNNFANLLDLCAAVLPTAPGRDGLPTGLTVLAPAFADVGVLSVVQAAHRHTGAGVATPAERAQALSDDPIELLVLGAHLRGEPLNHLLTQRGAQFRREVSTAACYRLVAIPGAMPKPGMYRVDGSGASIAGEVWALSPAALGAIVAETPAPLGFGSVELADGNRVTGFVCEADQGRDYEDISAYGGWRAWLAR